MENQPYLCKNSETSTIRGLRKQLENLQQLLDSLRDVICSIDEQGRFISISAAARQVWGYGPSELVGKMYMDLVVDADKEFTSQAACDIMSGIDMTNFENRYRCKDGSIKPIFWSAHWDDHSRIMFCVARDATEQKKADENHRLHERRLRRAYRLAGIAWWELDLATQTYTSSDEILAMYGLPAPEHNQNSVAEFLSHVHPEDVPRLQNDLAELSCETYFNYEHRIIRPNGEVAYLIHNSELIRDEQGNPVALHGTTKDITESKLYQLQLEASEKDLQQYARRLSDILESIGDGFFTVDRAWTVTYWNKKAEEILLKKSEEVLGKNLWDAYRDAIPLKFYSEYHRAVRQNIMVHFEEYFPPLRMWEEVNAYPSAEGLSVYFKDITQGKEQQRALAISNERYEFVSKATSDAIWDWNLETGLIYYNKTYSQLFGYESHSQSVTESWSNHIAEWDRYKVLQSLEKALKNREVHHWTAEYCFLRADGTTAHVLDRGTIIRNSNGQAIRMGGAMQDLTAQKEAEAQLKLSENKYRLLFFESSFPKWTFDAHTYRITDVNDAALKLYGYTRQEFLSLTIPELRAEGDKAPFFEAFEKLNQNQQSSYHHILRHKKKKGELFYVEIDSRPIELPSGQHFLVTGTDMTEKLELQQKLIVEKIAAQKEVANAIIDTQERERSEIGKELHDNVNQILTTIKLYMENVQVYPDHAHSFLEKGIALAQRAINEVRFLSKQLVTPVMADQGFRATMEELVTHFKSLNFFDITLTLAVDEKDLEKTLQLTIYRIVQEQLNNVVKYAQATSVSLTVAGTPSALIVIIEDNGVGFDASKATH